MIIEKIIEAVTKLYEYDVLENDILILISPITELGLLREDELNVFRLQEQRSIKTIMGCEVRNDYHDNESVVVYDTSDISRQRKIIIPI